jgi:uncharacterized protein YjbI with pentapeptide repeats
MIISNKDILVEQILAKAPKSLKKNNKMEGLHEVIIYRKTFNGITFSNDLTSLEFKNCKFNNCKFENVWGFFFLLTNCTLNKCEIRNSRFSHLEYCWENTYFNECFFTNSQFDEGSFFNVFFEKCTMHSTNFLGIVPSENVHFHKCNIENSQFQTLVYYDSDEEIDSEYPDLLFDNCAIEYSSFNSNNFTNSKFIDTVLFKTSFIDCQIGAETFELNEKNKAPNYASIDFQTILKSEEINPVALVEYFKIYDQNISEIIKTVSKKVNFHTVFISYSFKDKKIASLLNQMLTDRGIKTFIWEKDAPGGQRLEDIMSVNIKKHDKIIFLASENSIRSKACQYELSQGRMKQDDTWEEVIFPVHLDNFIFTVKKNQIRPLEKAEEYWKNIEELRLINSTDFIRFNVVDPKINDFEISVTKIINDLKLNNGST